MDDDIPGLAFLPDGGFDLSTPERRAAAYEIVLRSIAIVPQAYYAHGAAFCRDEMARHATQMVQSLREAREATGGSPDPGCEHAREVGDERVR